MNPAYGGSTGKNIQYKREDMVYLAELFRIFSSWGSTGITASHLGAGSAREKVKRTVRTLVIRSFEIDSVAGLRVGGRLDEFDTCRFAVFRGRLRG